MRDDETLLKSITSSLQKNAITAAVRHQFAVSVRNRLVTLSGNVTTWAQRKEAARIAILTRGVSAVDNRLTVEDYEYPWDEWYRQPTPNPPLYDLFLTPYQLDDYLHQT